MKFFIATAVVLYALALHTAAAPSEHATLRAGSGRSSEVLKLTQWTRPGHCFSHSGCQKLDKKQNTTRWTIKSLQGFDKDGKKPTNCTKKEFNKNDVSMDLQKRLNAAWPSFTSNNNFKAWEAVFNQDGKCVFNQTNTLNKTADYFQLALELYGRVNISAALANANIRPSDNTTTTLVAVRDAIKAEGYGHTVEIRCGNKRKGDRVLEEIAFCYNQTSLTPIDCKNVTCDTQNIWYLQNSSTFAMSNAFVVLASALLAVFFSKH